MDFTHILALILIMGATCAGVWITTVFPRTRDLAFFTLVAGAVLTERMDVNFFGDYWYRGTTRGVEVSLLDIMAFCLLVSSWLAPREQDRPRWHWPAGLGFMLLYFAYCLFSVLVSEPRQFGWFELTKVLRGILVFMAAASFVRTRRELALLVFALGCAVCLEGALGLKQRYLDGMYRVGGSVDDPNSLSMYLCLISPIFVAAIAADFPRLLRWFSWLCAGVAAFSILLTISRAGVPIFACVMLGATAFCVSWKLTFKKIAVGFLVFAVVGLAVLNSWELLMARYGEATLEEEYLDDQSEGRGVYLRWASAIVDDHFFGIGLNNWSYWVSKRYGPEAGFSYEDYDDIKSSPDKADLPSFRYAAPAHNLAALTAGELGVPGLFLFGLVWLRWFWMGKGFLRCRSDDPMRRIGTGIFFCVCGIFMQSMTEWVYRQTVIFFTFHVLAGTLASLHHHRLQERRLREVETMEAEDRGEADVEPEPAIFVPARRGG